MVEKGNLVPALVFLIVPGLVYGSPSSGGCVHNPPIPDSLPKTANEHCKRRGFKGHELENCVTILKAFSFSARNRNVVYEIYRTASLSCPKGYSFSGRYFPTRLLFECRENGKWDSDNTCRPFCQFRSPATNSRQSAVTIRAHVGTTKRLKCPRGFYFPDGSRSLKEKSVQCRPDGQWSSNVTCREGRACSVHPPTDHFRAVGHPMSVSGSKQAFQSGLVYRMKCLTGYARRSGSIGRRLRCVDGQWSRKLKCLPGCGIRKAMKLTLENSKRFAQVATTHNVTCKAGNTFPDGTSKMTASCTSNGWNVKFMKCT